jgi:hypothetical protein
MSEKPPTVARARFLRLSTGWITMRVGYCSANGTARGSLASAGRETGPSGPLSGVKIDD